MEDRGRVPLSPLNKVYSKSIYVINCSGKGSREVCQEKIIATNKFVFKIKTLPAWMENWSGPLVFEDFDDEIKLIWVQEFNNQLMLRTSCLL